MNEHTAKLPRATRHGAGWALEPSSRLPLMHLPHFTTVRTLLAQLALLALLACGSHSDPGPASAFDAFRIVQSTDTFGDPAKATAAIFELVARGTKFDAIVAHETTTAVAAADACKKNGLGNVQVVCVGGQADGQRLVLDGVLAAIAKPPTCASAALDLAMLTSNGVTFAPEQFHFRLGARIFTRANDTGETVATPADILLAFTRRQHAAMLVAVAGKPPLAIGVIQLDERTSNGKARRAELDAEVLNRPFLRLTHRSADGNSEQQAALITQLAAQCCRALIVADGDATLLSAACCDARKQGIKVVALHVALPEAAADLAVLPDFVAIGRALGRTISQSRKQGSAILELQSEATGKRASDLHAGLVQAAQITAPK